MLDYSTAYASTRRSSRVSVPVRSLSNLTFVTPLSNAPRHVLIGHGGERIVLDEGPFHELRSADGKLLSREPKPNFGQITILPSGYLLCGYERTWEGKEGSTRLNAGATDEGVQFALSVGEEIGSFVVLQRPTVERSQGTFKDVSARVSAGAVHFFLPERATSRLLWREEIEGRGCGAIDENHHIAVAMQAGRFIVFDGSHDTPDGTGPRLIDVPIPFAAYELSILDAGFALLSVGAPIADPRPYTELERALALSARRVEFPRDAPPRWTSVLHLLDKSGKQTFQANIPFEVYQPPVDAGNGRVYLLGNGVAAIENGKTLFVQPSTIPFFATAFRDGSLALAAGQELRILDRDGKIIQKFTTREHEPITTPPAIAADGSIWVGTAKGLYLAR